MQIVSQGENRIWHPMQIVSLGENRIWHPMQIVSLGEKIGFDTPCKLSP